MKKGAKTTPNLQLKQARERRGWSQEDVAQEIGTDAFTVSRWERGVTAPSAHFRQKLAALFDLNIIELGLLPATIDEPVQEVQVQPTERIEAAFTPFFDSAIPPIIAQEQGLVGRIELLQQLKQQLLSARALSALSGLPGVGKTALATALAHDEAVRAYFVDGVFWVGLGTTPDVLRQLSRWGTALHCEPTDLSQRSSPQAWAESIHAAIGQRRMLLIIDDAWGIAEARAFQLGGSRCTHLVTTRFPEIARHFTAEGAIVVHELDETDGRRLLMRLAPEAVQAEPEVAQALVSEVGGLPLALVLLGNFLRAQAHSGQPRRLRAALERLRKADERLRLLEPQPLVGGHPNFAAGTPLSLQAVIGMSDQYISKEARTALRALAVFPPKPNTFSEEAALAVSILPAETLDVLSDAGLLQSNGPARYTLHQTISDYARIHVTDTSAEERFVSYFVDYVEAHSMSYAMLENESNNILAALNIAFERGLHAALIQGVHVFAPLLITRGLSTIAETHLRRSLQAAQEVADCKSQATAHLLLGKIASQREDYEQTRQHWQQGLELAQTNGDSLGAAQTLREMGGFAWQQGRLSEAQQYLEEALTLLQDLEDSHSVAYTLNVLGNLVAEQGRPEQARQLYEDALALFRQLGNQHSTAIALQNLGILARERGEPELAHQLYMEALTLFRELGDQRSASAVLSNLGNLARHQGQPEQAQQFLEEGLLMQRQLENRRALPFILLNLGGLASDQGRFEQAQTYLDEALTVFQESLVQRGVALVLQELGRLVRLQIHVEQAQAYLNQSLAIFLDLKDQRQQAITQRELGILALLQGDFTQAHMLYTAALTQLVQIADLREIALTQRELGSLARQQGQYEEAHRLLTEALTLIRSIRDRHNAAYTLKELGLLQQQQEQWEQALPLFLSAGVGLTLIQASHASEIQKIFGLLRDKLGRDALFVCANRLAEETPEPAYGLTPAQWTTLVEQMAAQASFP